jgi:hypothetical protein
VAKQVPMLALCMSLLTGCERQLPLTLPPNTPAQVLESGGLRYTLDPESDGYRALDHWISNNRAGWSWGHYYAPPPAKGFRVRSGNLDLQFFDSTVLAHTPQGDYRKSVPPDEYAFLMHHDGDTRPR